MMARFERGQATTELTVSIIVAIPLILMTASLAKVADVNSSLVQAARYSAWEKAMVPNTLKTDEQIGGEIQARLLSAPESTLHSQNPTSIDAQNPYWRGWGTPDGDDSRYFTAGTDDLSISITDSAPPGAGTQWYDVGTRIGNAMGEFVGGRLDLNENGFYKATVSANIRSDRYLMDTNNSSNCAGHSDAVFVCARRDSAILADTWAAESPEQTAERVRKLMPIKVFDGILAGISDLSPLPLYEELGDLKNAPGYVEADAIPADRLGATAP
jgi:hypothetical protein